MESGDIAAAVAVIHSERHLLLLRRAHNPLDPWSGHIALPGGRLESGESLVDAARRETFEETGIVLDPSHCLGPLPPASAGRRPMLVQPFLFRLDRLPPTRPDPEEVAWAEWIPLDELSDLSRHRLHTFIPGRQHPCVPVRDTLLWGFTYGVLARWLAWDGLPE
ncbi:MAG: hypothetical protein RL095_2286 [Verrucomicrobiota bacterium]|jgi:8-oxo-dGTP pyrophosphatase MutT (NUDIX family)